MAYTMTVLAWSMVEFQNAYENSGDWQAALDLLKWGTDYLIKAHTDKYELYVQVRSFRTYNYLQRLFFERLVGYFLWEESTVIRSKPCNNIITPLCKTASTIESTSEEKI